MHLRYFKHKLLARFARHLRGLERFGLENNLHGGSFCVAATCEYSDKRALFVEVRTKVQGSDVRFGLSFEPHGLPDARRRCVPDAVGLAALLAARLPVGV